MTEIGDMKILHAGNTNTCKTVWYSRTISQVLNKMWIFKGSTIGGDLHHFVRLNVRWRELRSSSLRSDGDGLHLTFSWLLFQSAPPRDMWPLCVCVCTWYQLGPRLFQHLRSAVKLHSSHLRSPTMFTRTNLLPLSHSSTFNCPNMRGVRETARPERFGSFPVTLAVEKISSQRT